MTLPLQGKYLLVSVGLCTKIYLPSPPKMICILYYQDQNNHPPHNSQFSTLHIPLHLYWDAKTYRVISGALRMQLPVHISWITNWECVMTKGKEEVSTSNLQPKEHYLWTIHSTIHKEGCYLFPINFYSYLLVPLTPGKNNIQMKRKSSIVNKLFTISYIFGKYFCTILAKVLKLHKARTHSSSCGGAFAYAVLGGNGRHMVFESLKSLF